MKIKYIFNFKNVKKKINNQKIKPKAWNTIIYIF